MRSIVFYSMSYRMSVLNIAFLSGPKYEKLFKNHSHQFFCTIFFSSHMDIAKKMLQRVGEGGGCPR
jgi:hypothetical protein